MSRCVTKEDTTAAPGTVLDVTPAAGTNTPLTDRVTLTVAKAPGQVNLPDLKGKTVSDANKIIQDLGLKVGGQTQKDDKDLKAGLVISSDPPAGLRRQGRDRQPRGRDRHVSSCPTSWARRTPRP